MPCLSSPRLSLRSRRLHVYFGPLAILGLAVALPACPAFDLTPCFPASSASPLDESDGGFSRQTLAWELDKMAALVDAPESDQPASATFLKAQRDMRTEFWVDAAKGFLAVVRGDTGDGKKIRLHAQYDFGLALFRLRYFEEAKRVFRMIAADPKHPMNSQAADWMSRKVCAG